MRNSSASGKNARILISAAFVNRYRKDAFSNVSPSAAFNTRLAAASKLCIGAGSGAGGSTGGGTGDGTGDGTGSGTDVIREANDD